MSILKRAFLYVTRKRSKSLILFLILLVVSTLALSGVAIKNAAGTAQLNVRQALGGVFTLRQNTSDPGKWITRQVGGYGSTSYYGGVPLSTKLGNYITDNTSGIRGYNASYTNYVVAANSAGKTLELLESADDGSGMTSLLASFGDFGSTVSTYASTNTAFDSYFAGGYLSLTEGRHLTDADNNCVLISKELAEKNGLKLGDHIKLHMSTYKASMLGENADSTEVEVEIIGLFQSTAKSTTMLSNWSMDNSLYTTMDVLRRVRPDMGEESYESIQFYVDDPGKLDAIVAAVKALPNLDPTDFVVSVDSSDVDAVLEPLANMDKLVSVMIALVLAVGAIVLYLVLASRMKERSHESGVLLSLGVSKGKIIGQYMLEIVLIAVVALTLSVFTSDALAKTIGAQLLDYSIADTGVAASSKNVGTSIDGMSLSSSADYAPQFEARNDLTQIEVSLESATIIWVYAVVLAIIALSVLLAALPVMRLKPREILTKMS